MKTLLIPVGVALVTMFGALCVYNTVNIYKEDEALKTKFNSINKSLKDWETNYKNVNKELEQSNSEKDRFKKEKEELEKQKAEVDKKLQAKLENQAKIAKASEAAVNVVTNTKTASASSGASSSIEQTIIDAANKYGVSSSMMLRLAQCESTMGKFLRNPKPVIVGGVSYGHAEGVFQFIPSTWTRMSNEAGFAGKSVYDTYANVNTAAHAFSTGKKGEWECS